MTSEQTATSEQGRVAEKPVLRVTSSHILAARLWLLTSKDLGEPVPEWVRKVADAEPAGR